MSTRIRLYGAHDATDILRLNRKSENLLSPMDSQRFAHLRQSGALVFVAEHAESIAGFLIGFHEGADYDSVNYQWFLKNTQRFLYIDRVVISETLRGLGIARLLYEQVKVQARADGLEKIVAEINAEPPNMESLEFHRKQGFREMATQNVGVTKIVSLQCLDL
ncbi:MAG: GNAT family N-acetyltransferase [Gammaproteobacteria bacterium]|nr:GNAT family N-acetyltransferase [Gammaproteobacteria bacterium]